MSYINFIGLISERNLSQYIYDCGFEKKGVTNHAYSINNLLLK
jgi:hypothetical protein